MMMRKIGIGLITNAQRVSKFPITEQQEIQISYTLEHVSSRFPLLALCFHAPPRRWISGYDYRISDQVSLGSYCCGVISNLHK